MIDRLPVPFGLVRYGVAPDHPSIRSIRNTLERTLEKSGVRFYGDVDHRPRPPLEELRGAVDAVIYALRGRHRQAAGDPGRGPARQHRAPRIWSPGTAATPTSIPDPGRPASDHQLTGRRRSTSLLARAPPRPSSSGVGNVALDVARILIKPADQLADTDMADEVLESLSHKQVTDVHVLGRRGPAYTAFTTKELRELGQIDGVDVIIEPGRPRAGRVQPGPGRAGQGRGPQCRRPPGVGRPRTPAGRRPTDAPALLDPTRSRSSATTGSRAVAGRADHDRRRRPGRRHRRDQREIAAQLVVRSVGYRGQPLPGVPYDESTGRVPHAEGRVIRDGGFSADEYVTGWIKRGPTGVIGTNKSDAVETVTSLLADVRRRRRPGARAGRRSGSAAGRAGDPAARTCRPGTGSTRPRSSSAISTAGCGRRWRTEELLAAARPVRTHVELWPLPRMTY